MESVNEAARDPRAVVSHSSFTERDFEGHHALTMYVGVHVMGNRHKRHHHHHHHHQQKLQRTNSDAARPSTPPSERVRFIIGSDEDESHSPHPVFSEMEELFWTGNKMEWMETARWIKFEEDVEEGGNKWSKPHIATVSLHALLVLRSALLNGSVIFDVQADSIEVVADHIINDMVLTCQLSYEHKEYVKRVLLSNHRHKQEQYFSLWKESKATLHPVKSLADIEIHNLPSRQMESYGGNDAIPASAELSMAVEDNKALIVVASSESGSTSFETGIKQFPRNHSMPPLSQIDHSKDQADSACDGSQLDSEGKREEYKLCKASFMKKIPPDANASNILVGELPFLEKTVTAFVRLENACILKNLTEIPLPTKFMFVILCPANNIESYHEVGRAFATVMSDEARW